MINIKTALILLLIFVFAACAISKKENERLEKKDSGKEFSNDITMPGDTVSKENLKYFENRAIQKLIDFYDYLNMLGHDNFNNTIMEEIRSSAGKLFFDPKIKINPYIADPQVAKSQTLVLLLKENIGDNALPEIDILNVEIAKELQSQEAEYFKGILNFDIKNDEASIIVTKEATFSLRKIEKKFGEDSVMVWEVFLDCIY